MGRDKAIILFRQAQVHHEEKREWYRFVYNHTKTEEEFNEIVQTESLASYKRLMLGLEEDMEDDIHERVTREIVQASNVATDPTSDAPAKKKDKKKKKKAEDEDGWFGEEAAEPKKSKKKKDKKKKKKAEDEGECLGEEPAEPKKSKKK